jgi:hypothetical protein
MSSRIHVINQRILMNRVRVWVATGNLNSLFSIHQEEAIYGINIESAAKLVHVLYRCHR